MLDFDPETPTDAAAKHLDRKDVVFVEQTRLLYQTHGVIAISLIIAGLSAAGVWQVFPAAAVGTWILAFCLVVAGRLLLCRYHARAVDHDATARTWCLRFVAGNIGAGTLWGIFGCAVLTTSDPLYHVFAVFVIGGVIAGSMIGNATYLPAFYGYMLPSGVPAVVFLVTRPDQMRMEMGVMLALFVAVLAIVGRNLNRSILGEIRLGVEQGVLLTKLGRSEDLMAEAQSIAHVGHWQFNEAGNSFIVSNEAYRIYGVDPATFKMSLETVVARVHPDDRAMIDKDFRQAMANRTSFGADHRIVLDDGTIRFVYITGKAFCAAGRQSLYMVGTVQDITERKTAEAKLQFANTLQAAELEASPDGILVVDANGEVLSYNRRLGTIWGNPPAGVPMWHESILLPHAVSLLKEPAKFLARVEYLYAHPSESGEDEFEMLDGRCIVRITAGLRSETGESLGRVWFFRDITPRRQAEASVLRSARFDTLTGLANRAVAVEAIQRAIAQSKRDAKPFAVIYVDLDHFKDVNDTLGHPVGDALLCSIAERLRSSASETDTVARFGGDEFAVVAVDIHEPADAGVLADKLIDALGEPYLIRGNPIQSTASIGIEFYGPEAPDAETLLSHAEIALYRAKSEGRGRYRFFTGAMDAEVRTRVTLGAEFRAAFAGDQFFLLYQPQVRIDSGRIVGVEALVRWRHPSRGVLGPQMFISLAERLGLIRKLTHWVLWTACRQGKAWLDSGYPPIRIAVNFSALEFKTPNALENDIITALEETGLPPIRLELELTESVLMGTSREHNDVLQRLRRRGITIAIDDFGTGYSSLLYLRQFPSDRIKIAQEFMSGLKATSESAAIVKATISLGRDLGLIVIAEGVENREQLDLLSGWGCTEVQGYYYAKPLAPKELAPLLSSGEIIHMESVSAAG